LIDALAQSVVNLNLNAEANVEISDQLDKGSSFHVAWLHKIHATFLTREPSPENNHKFHKELIECILNNILIFCR
jgi:hypothetical protein